MLRHECCSGRLYACKAADATDRMAMIDKLLELAGTSRDGAMHSLELAGRALLTHACGETFFSLAMATAAPP